MASLICFLVLLPSTTNAQRAAIGIGSKLKQAFGTRSVSVSRLENKPKTLQEGKLVVQDDHMKVMEKMDLGFSGFKMELKAKKKNQTSRLILDGSIRGRAQPGRMLAIMGPSGAGKSSVMHALAGKVKESSRIQLEGSRYINGHTITGASQIPAAFVKQEVSFFPYMTVRETLAFRVELKLGSLISKEAQADRVD